MILPAVASLVVFVLDEQQFAVSLSAVERVVRAVAISPLPGAPAGVRGVINVQGKILPVFDPRARFGLAVRDLRTSDHLLIAQTGQRGVALLVDCVSEIIEADAARMTTAGELLPGINSIEGVTKCDGEIVFIYDLEKFLSLGEESALAAAMGA